MSVAPNAIIVLLQALRFATCYVFQLAEFRPTTSILDGQRSDIPLAAKSPSANDYHLSILHTPSDSTGTSIFLAFKLEAFIFIHCFLSRLFLSHPELVAKTSLLKSTSLKVRTLRHH